MERKSSGNSYANGGDKLSNWQPHSRSGLTTLAAGVSVAFLAVLLGPTSPTQAALVEGGKGPQLLIGLDDDNQTNAAIQAGVSANQSLNRTDILEGGQGNDVMFGLNGNDVIDGGPGVDIILGGPDNDVNLWAPGDGSEAFIGGPGLDAIVFGATDRESVPDPRTNVQLPTLQFGLEGFPQGIPTADVSGLPQHCTVELSSSPGYDYLVRFRAAAGTIIVTVRVGEVEQVFCPSGAGIAFADLTSPTPVFVDVSRQEVDTLNPLVAAMIR
jgi:hypothetical protein